MNRQEFLIGVCVYALIIAAGYSGPLWTSIHWPQWEKSSLQNFWLWFHPAADQTVFEAKPKVKTAVRCEPKVVQVIVRDPNRLIREENWKKMAAHSSIGGAGQDSPDLSDRNPLLKARPPALPKKTATPPEPSKG